MTSDRYNPWNKRHRLKRERELKKRLRKEQLLETAPVQTIRVLRPDVKHIAITCTVPPEVMQIGSGLTMKYQEDYIKSRMLPSLAEELAKYACIRHDAPYRYTGEYPGERYFVDLYVLDMHDKGDGV